MKFCLLFFSFLCFPLLVRAAELPIISASNYEEFGLTEENWSDYDGFYALSNGDDLRAFATLVNDGDSLANALMMTDVTFNEGKIVSGESSSFEKWTPIGSEEKPYYGIFDGGGHSVSGLYTVKEPSTGGLFGATKNAVIRNVAIFNSSLWGYSAGAICGIADSTIIENCFTSAYVGAVYGGGICGEAFGGTHISDCFSSCNLFCSSMGGGIVAYAHRRVKMDNCVCTGQTTRGGRSPGPDRYILFTCFGTMIGASDSDLTMDSCFADSAVCPRWDIYYLRKGEYSYSDTKNFTTQPMCSDTLSSHLSDAWIARDGYYPMLKSYADSSFALAAVPLYLSEGDSYDTLRSDFALPKIDGLQWKVSSPTEGSFVSLDSVFRADYYQGKDTLYAFWNEIPVKTAYINVMSPEYDSMKVLRYPVTTIYAVGDSLKLDSGMVALYRDSTERIIPIEAKMVSGFNGKLGGEYVIPIVFRHDTIGSYTVSVVKEVDSCFFIQSPKLSYNVGDDIDLSAGQLLIIYNDSTTEFLQLKETSVIGFSSELSGAYTLSVSRDDKLLTTYDVKIINSIVNVQIAKLPKQEYFVNEAFDASGLLHLYYNDGILDSCSITDTMVKDFSTAKGGDFSFPIYYEDTIYVGDYNVNVLKRPAEFNLLSLPKGHYFVGEAIDVDGAQLNITYDDSTMGVVAITPPMVKDFSTAKGGDFSFPIYYEDTIYVGDYNIFVERRADSISIEMLPKTHFYVGDTLSLDGGSLRVFYDDSTSAVVSLSDSMILDFSTLEAGEFQLNVSYAGLYTSYDVVVEKESTSLSDGLSQPKYQIFSGNGFIRIKSFCNGSFSLFDLSGSLLQSFSLESNEERVIELNAGIYIVGKEKVIVE